MSEEVDRLRDTLERRLVAAGVTLAPARLDELAEEVMQDALRVALLWVEPD